MKSLLILMWLVLPSFNTHPSPPPKPLREGLRVYVEQVREPFPDIGLKDAVGKEQHLSNSKGTLRLVNFWATWCTPCVEELPQLQALQQKYPDQLRVLAVNEDGKGFEAITPFVKEHALGGLSHYHDRDQLEYTKLQMQGLPMSFLVDAKGNLVATIEGKIDWLGPDMAELIKKANASP